MAYFSSLHEHILVLLQVVYNRPTLQGAANEAHHPMAKAGVQPPRRWVFGQGKTYEAELRFVLTIQRGVLFI
jgi:hypothetical protein